ncbi:DUF6538 domain-containing protein [Methylocystis echinoides]|uniref:Tyr recombinase domain-containing protein n=1 Tax=Methylocystis echinoides TaxID=29468 RepID=A0A9W6GY22_9HYPH|nr:DUF6538 domain-containing protein [Methylocystis echinoides]GLI94975.1 hypothetical protein LMG27198_39670 [Methylocystis echinoides]
MKLPPYIQRSPKTGALSFRLSVPPDCRGAYGPREIRKSLKTKDSKRAAILAVKLCEEAQERFAAIRAGKPVGQQEPTDLEAYHQAISWLKKMGLSTNPLPHPESSPQALQEWNIRDVMADEILDKYRDHSDPEEETFPNISKLESYKVAALQGSLKRPHPRISDALTLYLAERNPQGKRTPEKAHKFKLEAERNIAHLISAIDDKRLTDINRVDARVYRDHLLDIPTLSPTSVNKALEVVRKVINHSIVENDLNIQNPFRKLAVEEEVAGRDKRLPFTVEQFKAYLSAMREHSNADAYGVSVLMAYYGCRTEEVTGIELADIDLTGKTPFFHIRGNSTRPSLKTNTSQRKLPLLGKALEVVRESYKAAQDKGSKTLFPRYSEGKGATTVSAVQCKVVRRYVSQDKKLVPYSARHLMMDALKNSGANETIRNEILGHSSGKVSEVYGAGYALEKLSEALKKVNATLDHDQQEDM